MSRSKLETQIVEDIVAELRMTQDRYAYAALEAAKHPSADVRAQGEVYALKARRFGQLADRAEREFADADQATTRYAVRVEEHHNRYLRTKAVLTGPALTVMATLTLGRIADAARGEGELVEAWDEYTTARLNLDRAAEDIADEIDVAYYVGVEADALRVLLAGLPKSLRLPLPEARAVTDLLFEATGRIGVVEK